MKEALIKPAAVDGERFFVKIRFEKRGIGGKDPSSAVRGFIQRFLNMLLQPQPRTARG